MRQQNDAWYGSSPGTIRNAVLRQDAGEPLLSFLARLARFGLLSGMSPLLRPFDLAP